MKFIHLADVQREKNNLITAISHSQLVDCSELRKCDDLSKGIC